jgi:hypothetical protein
VKEAGEEVEVIGDGGRATPVPRGGPATSGGVKPYSRRSAGIRFRRV